ncbi:ATP-binding protein [Yinghuangia sp. YIM S09857]|uniref:ATP-binding protein n=1 Tax=Yinghuangia sp. YIM S09857 TaxID=3436929 RepID=UPI003F53CDA1
MNWGPHTLVLDLDETPGAVRRARDLTTDFLRECPGPTVARETVRDIVMVVAELVSNAYRHAPGPYRLTVSAEPDRVAVAMRDGGETWLAAVPDARPPGGFGLLVVRRLSRTLDVEVVPGGKVLTAIVPRDRA